MKLKLNRRRISLSLYIYPFSLLRASQSICYIIVCVSTYTPREVHYDRESA